MKLSRGEKIIGVLNYIALTCLSLAFLIPFLSVLSTSFVSRAEFNQRGAFILIPHKIDLSAYKLLLARGSIIINAYKVTLFRVWVGTSLNLLFTTTLAYVLAKQDLPGRIPMTVFVFFTMLFSGGLVPNFVLMENLGLLDTLWAMILPGLINPWNMFVMRNFFMAIPREIEDAAIIDGATPPLILTRIILPLSLPSIATVGLFYAVAHWNAWFDAAIYISDRMKYPVQAILQSLLAAGLGFAETVGGEIEADVIPPPGQVLKAAMIVVGTVPILLVYPFIQRYFVKGAMVGSIKG